MSVFVVAVLMAGLGYYWGLHHRESGAPRPQILPFAWPAALYLLAVGVLFVPVAGTECTTNGMTAFARCELAKRSEVAVYLIVTAGVLAGCAGAWFGGNLRARWWLFVAWVLPLLLGWSVR